MFKYGISFDTDGYMQVDEDELTEALTDNYSDVKELFTGYAEKEGIGTRLKTYLDSLDGLDGLLTVQFAEYTALITQMENSFASLKLIIEGDDS